MLAVTGCLASRWLLGWFCAFPVISAVSALGTGSLEHGDRALFAPSSLMLLELLRRGQEPFAASAPVALLLFVVALIVNTAPVALLFSVFAGKAEAAKEVEGKTDARRALCAALSAAPRFVLIGAAELILLCLVLLLALALWPGELWAEAPAELLTAGSVGLSCLGLATGLAIVLDLWRAHGVSPSGRLRDALARALESFRSAPLELVAGYVLFVGLGALTVAVVARAVELCRVELEGLGRVGLVFLLHVSALLTLTLLQALWARRLGRVIRASKGFVAAASSTSLPGA